MDKKLNEIKNEFKKNHAARMEELNSLLERLNKAQKPEPKETKNTKRLKTCNDLLSSL